MRCITLVPDAHQTLKRTVGTAQVRFTREQIVALDRLAVESDRSRSWHVRNAIAEFLRRQK